ncbi:hypothetical protein [Streptomyces sp. NPDC088794]|uniref:hypothetical protein n=1 Tax=Streptomyces sp. NPDC088794 TaxID=3365902 RepID=UPI00381C44EC
MPAPLQAPREGPQAPVPVISDRTDADPVGLRPNPVPQLHRPSHLFSAEEYQRAPLVLLDDLGFTGFALRHMPRRPGLIVVLVDPDNSTIYPRAAAIGAEAVIRAGDSTWLHLHLHDATGCRYAHWETLLAGGPADPPSQHLTPRTNEPPRALQRPERADPCIRYPNAAPIGRWQAGWWCRT